MGQNQASNDIPTKQQWCP